MQGPKDQVAGFGCGNGEFNGLEVAHLADQNNIGVLAQGRLQGCGKGLSMATHFPLIDQALLTDVNKFDGILYGKDVLFAGFVHMIDHRRQGGRLAATRWPGDQNQTFFKLSEVENPRR